MADDFEGFDDNVVRFNPDAAPQSQVALPFINISAWEGAAVPQQQWTVLNRIPRRQTVLFSGEGAAGKSMTALHLVAAHVLGRDWLGALPEIGPALFLEGEDDVDVLHRRLDSIRLHYGVRFGELKNLHLLSFAGRDATLATPGRGNIIQPTKLYGQLLQACGDIKPVQIVLASSANLYAGNEMDRHQVMQFIAMLTHIAIVANGSVVLISHPSVAGISSNSGISGSTQWHNSVRSRFYMKGMKADNGEDEPDSDLREIVFKKNNYGPISETLVLKFRNGMFLPLAGVSSLDKAARDQKAEQVFMSLLERFNKQNRAVGLSTGHRYAPTAFGKESEAVGAELTRKELEGAMTRLLEAKRIENVPEGPPSRRTHKLIVAELVLHS